MMTGPRRLDAHQKARVLPGTLKQYQAAAWGFVCWARLVRIFPEKPEEWDDALVEYKNFKGDSEDPLSLAKFTQLVSAVEFFFPRAKGKLALSHAVLKGWGISHVTRHTVPMGRGPCALFACFMAAEGRPRLGAGCVLQSTCGLRPSEMLNLKGGDLSFPEERGLSAESEPIIVGLGLRTGTKLKRPQVALVRPQEEPELALVLRLIAIRTGVDEQLVPYSLDQYRKQIKWMEGRLEMNIGWGPHSPRAGFASDARAAGKSFEEVREQGRWQADSSLRTYLDVMQAAQIALSLKSAGLAPSIAWALRVWSDYVERGLEGDAAEGGQKAAGRLVGGAGQRWQCQRAVPEPLHRSQ